MRTESRLSKCYWTCLALLLVSHSTLAGLASRSLMREQEEPRGILSQSLDSLLERQDVLEDTVDFLDNLEADFLIALEDLIIDQEAQDRVLLEDVQNLIFAVQSASQDPTLTPVALAAIATNPTSVFLIGSLVASTVIASQVSSYALVGQTLTFDSQQGGLIRVLLDIVEAFMSVFSGGNTDREDEGVEDGSGSGDSQEDGGSGSGSGDYEDYEEMDGSGEGDLLSSVASVIRQVLGGPQDEDEDYMEDSEQASGETSGTGAENDSFHVDIAEDSFLDWVFNIIPDTVNSITGGEEYDYEYVYDEDNRQGMNISTEDPSNGGGNYGGMTVSLHTVDLAKLFVDVQKSVLENTSGMNCTCGENLLTEESITNATIKIVQAQAEQQVKRKRLLEKKKRLLRNNRIPKVLQD